MDQVNNLNQAGGQSLLNKLHTGIQSDNFMRYPNLIMRSMSHMTDNGWKFATQTQPQYSSSWNLLHHLSDKTHNTLPVQTH